MPTDPKSFWEEKILVWEGGRYQSEKPSSSLLERIADWSSDSLRYRISIAGELLAPHVRDKRVVDLGCGSGLLAPAIIRAGAKEYVGYDIAEVAIANAHRVAEEAGITLQTSFHVGAIADLPPLEADIVVSLGLTDWLTDDELREMFAKSGSAHYLHAISERRPSLYRWFHMAYVYVAYGHRTEGYVPRYFPASHLPTLAQPHRDGAAYAYRHRRLSFGALISSLPIGDPIPGFA